MKPIKPLYVMVKPCQPQFVWVKSGKTAMFCLKMVVFCLSIHHERKTPGSGGPAEQKSSVTGLRRDPLGGDSLWFFEEF